MRWRADGRFILAMDHQLQPAGVRIFEEQSVTTDPQHFIGFGAHVFETESIGLILVCTGLMKNTAKKILKVC